MGKCLFWEVRGRCGQEGQEIGPTQNIKMHHQFILSILKWLFVEAQGELCTTSIDIRGSESFGRCWGLFSSHCKNIDSRGWGGVGGVWLRKRWFTSPNMKVSPTIKLLLMEVVSCFYWLMLFKPLATGVNALVFQWRRAAFLHIFQNSLCTGYVGFKGFGAGVWHHLEGNSPFFSLSSG